MLDDATAARHTTALRSVGLPTALGDLGLGNLDFDSLLATMRVDKKSRGDSLRFVVLSGLGRPTILTDPDEAALRAAYDHLAGAAS